MLDQRLQTVPCSRLQSVGIRSQFGIRSPVFARHADVGRTCFDSATSKTYGKLGNQAGTGEMAGETLMGISKSFAVCACSFLDSLSQVLWKMEPEHQSACQRDSAGKGLTVNHSAFDYKDWCEVCKLGVLCSRMPQNPCTL